MRPLPVLLSAVLSLSFASSVAAAGMWGSRGISQRFIVNGSVLYAAEGRGVAAYDISNPTAIQQIDVELSDDETYDIALRGTGELVAATKRGIDRFAITSGGALERRDSVAHVGSVERITASDRHVAAASDRDLSILDQSGSSLQVIGTRRFTRRILAVTFVGSYLYVSVERQATFVIVPATGDQIASLPVTVSAFAQSGSTLWGASFDHGLVGIDVGTPDRPRLIGTTGSEELRLAGVAAAGTHVFAFESPRTIRVFDAATIAEPRLIATVEDWAEVIAASVTHFFVSGPLRDPEGLRYESGAQVRAYSAVNPAVPSIAGEFRSLAGPVSGVWTDGSIAYVVDPPHFRVLDVSTTASPREIRSIELPDRAQQRVRVKDGMAIVYGRDLVHLIDVTSPLQPVYVATWDPQGRPPSDAALLGSKRFVEANDHSGLHVVDYSNPAASHQVGGRIWHYHSVAAGDDAVYALQQSYFLTLEVGTGGAVVDRDILAVNGAQIESSPPNVARPAHVVVRRTDGLTVYALENRFAPRETTRLELQRPGVLGAGAGYALFESDGVLHRLELGGSAAPIATNMKAAAPMQISVAGEKVVVADRYSVRVYGPDTAPPDEPPPPPPPVPGRRRSARH